MANYVNNKSFLKALIQYREDVENADEDEIVPIPEYIGECILQIATNLSTKPNFSGYDFKEDMIYDGVENCLVYVGKFDPERSDNPFAYFTQIIWNAFIRRIKKEKKKMYVVLKMQEEQDLEREQDTEWKGSQGDVNYDKQNFHENMTKFIEDFERNHFKKKKKKKTKTNPLNDMLNEEKEKKS